MGIICRQCGYENPDGATICELCAESLGNAGGTQDQSFQQAVPQPSVQPVRQMPVDIEATVRQINTVPQDAPMIDDGNEYFVLCPESQTKTVLASGNVSSFYCNGCKKQHEIDGFLWVIEKKEKAGAQTAFAHNDAVQQSVTAPKGDDLWLEEVNSHTRIDIDKAGGTLGRYGKYGAEFFQSRGLLMVSGEHCMITYEFGNWVIRHISRTNQTMYNNMILGSNEPNLLEDGKVLTLANAVSFIVRIG